MGGDFLHILSMRLARDQDSVGRVYDDGVVDAYAGHHRRIGAGGAHVRVARIFKDGVTDRGVAEFVFGSDGPRAVP